MHYQSSYSVSEQTPLRHDELHSDILNREMFDFYTELLECNQEQSPNTKISDSCTERGIEPSTKYRTSADDVYVDVSNQTSDLQLAQSNHSFELQLKFYEKSVGIDKIVGTNGIWEEQVTKLKNTQNNKYE